MVVAVDNWQYMVLMLSCLCVWMQDMAIYLSLDGCIFLCVVARCDFIHFAVIGLDQACFAVNACNMTHM